MLQVKKIVGSTLSSNMYILFEENTSDCWIVDIGDYNALEKKLPLNACVKGIFLTHGHFDHIADINLLHEKFPNSIIYTSEYGKEQLYSAKKNFSFYHEKSTVFTGDIKAIQILQNGDSIKLFDDIYINVLETPGHCPSCLTYFSRDYIFTGDSYIPDVPIVTKLPKGNRVQAIASAEIVKKLAQTRIILAGHNRENWQTLL